MTTPIRALRAADGGRLELDSIVAALATRYVVVAGPRRFVRRVRLDTFDGRLLADGMTLEHQSLASGELLAMAGPGLASTRTMPVNDLRWPASSDRLPIGPIREAIAPVIGIRALMVASDQARVVRMLELHNEDAKTVARVELDEPDPSAPPRPSAAPQSSAPPRPSAAPQSSAPPQSFAAPAQVLVHGLLGYEDEARRAFRLLSGLGLRAVEPGEDGASGEDGEPTSSPRLEQLDRGEPATVLLASALGDFLTAMRDNLPGLVDNVDTEFLHDFRVAVRRTRATLKLGRPALPEEMRSSWEPAFKRLGDWTTPVRDLDVYELDLPTMAGWLVGADAADLEPFATHLRRRRTAERRTLVRRLRSAGFERLLTDWESEIADLARESKAPNHPNLTAGRWADRSISRAYKRVASGGSAISGDSPAEDLHTLRKRCKELRYALEVCAPMLDKGPRKLAVADLKGLQDVLGRFQDTEVERQALRGFAEEMMADGTPAAAVLAMGELIGHLDVEQDQARTSFDGAFARFAAPANQQMMSQLGGRP